MKIETGEPRETGSYVCYMHGVDVPTVVRFWLVGTGWLNNLKEPVAGSVAGWIGPLPYMNEGTRSARWSKLENGGERVEPITQEFDL